MLDLKNLGQREMDKLFAEKFEVSDKTIRNYKKLENPNFIPATGKIHLYKAMYLYMYLKEFENEENESELFNRAELLLQSIESLESNISLLDKEDLQIDIKDAVNSSIKRDIDTIKEIVKEIL